LQRVSRELGFSPAAYRPNHSSAIGATDNSSVGMAGMADLIERKSLKLLAQAGQVLNQIVSEGLCDEPQKKHMDAMLAELRGMLDEFEEAYFGG
jgi:hypothetical protein